MRASLLCPACPFPCILLSVRITDLRTGLLIGKLWVGSEAGGLLATAGSVSSSGNSMMRGQWMPVERAFRYMSRNIWRLVLKFLLFLFALLLSVTMGVARRARARVVSYRMQLRELRQRQTTEANDRDRAQRERVESTRRRKDCAVCLKPAKYRCARCEVPRFWSASSALLSLPFFVSSQLHVLYLHLNLNLNPNLVRGLNKCQVNASPARV